MTVSVPDAFVPHSLPGRLIVLEGMPGSGKTSAVLLAAHATDSVVLPELDHVTDRTADAPADPAAIQRWYVDRERGRQAGLRHILRDGRAVLQDRCILSTLAFAYAQNAHITGLSHHMAALLTGTPRFTLPDTLFLTLVDIDVSIRRRQAWRHSHAYAQWFDRRFLGRLDEFYRSVAPRLLPCSTITVDTTSASVSDVAALVEQAVVSSGSRGPVT